MLLNPETINRSKIKWNLHREICQTIMNGLMNFPCSYLLSITFETQLPNTPMKTLSFPIIQDNITNNIYTEVKEWILDVKLYFKAALSANQYNAKRAVYYDFLQKFQKRVRDLEVTSVKGWYRKILSLKLKIDDLIQHSPPATQPYFPYPKSIEYTTKKAGLSHIEFIIENYNKVKDPASIRELMNIINLDIDAPEPNDGIIEVDLGVLKTKTRCKLFDLIRSKIQEPENPLLNPS